jgi:hypothetical protein
VVHSTSGARHAEMHPPSAQKPRPQPLPHCPQFAGSTEVSTQAPLQVEKFDGHEDWQRPCTQKPASQACPQPPQSERLELVSTHRPLHSTWGGRHEASAVHRPIEHTCVPVHAAPHAPQCRGSDAVAKQPPSQSVVPAGHRSTQARLAQTAPGAHAAPHAPQLNESVSRSTHPELPSQVVHGRGDVPVHPAAAPRTKPVRSASDKEADRTGVMKFTRRWPT